MLFYIPYFYQNQASLSNTPTIKEIAKRLNISPSSVSRALHGHDSIGTDTKMKVKKLALELNYEPNQRAISFQQKKSYSIGVILPELSEAFFSTAVSGIEDTVGQHNYTVLLGQSHDDENREKQVAENMKRHSVDGLIVSVAKNTAQYAHFDIFARLNIPVLFFDRIPNLLNIHSVSCNIEQGAIQAVDYLLENNHTTIGLINGPKSLFASQQREAGYNRAITGKNLKFDARLIVYSDLTKESTQKAMADLLQLKKRPTAVVVFNDYVAMDAIQFARQKNLTINKDITFASFANLPLNAYMDYPPAASIEQFPYQQGQNLLNYSAKTANEQTFHKISVEPKLVVHKNAVLC
jgi:LacI family transcriptional regulator